MCFHAAAVECGTLYTRRFTCVGQCVWWGTIATYFEQRSSLACVTDLSRSGVELSVIFEHSMYSIESIRRLNFGTPNLEMPGTHGWMRVVTKRWHNTLLNNNLNTPSANSLNHIFMHNTMGYLSWVRRKAIVLPNQPMCDAIVLLSRWMRQPASCRRRDSRRCVYHVCQFRSFLFCTLNLVTVLS